MAEKVVVVGMGMSARDLPPAYLEVIRSAEVLVGGSRHLAQFEDVAAEKRVIRGAMDATLEFIRTRRIERRVVVLASGDPLFFGIGHTLARALGRDQVTILPNITAIAAAFERARGVVVHAARTVDDPGFAALRARCGGSGPAFEAAFAEATVELQARCGPSPD